MNEGWVKDERMCVVITNTQWFENCKEQVSGFLPLWRNVFWIIVVKIWKYYYRWLFYRCKWDVLILIWVNISKKNPSDEYKWSWVRNRFLKNKKFELFLYYPRNQSTKRTEPCIWFRPIRRWKTRGTKWPQGPNHLFGSGQSIPYWSK